MESIFKGTHVRDNGKEKKWSIGRSELSVGSWNSAECQMTVLLLVVCSMMLISDFGWYLCVVVILADLKTWLMFWQTDHSWTGFTKHTFFTRTWPSPSDLDIQTWCRYWEAVPAYRKEVFCAGAFIFVQLWLATSTTGTRMGTVTVPGGEHWVTNFRWAESLSVFAQRFR